MPSIDAGSCQASLHVENKVESQVEVALTGGVGHQLELLLPELGDLDGFPLADDALRGHPLLIGVYDHLVEEVGLDGIDDIEEVLPARALADGELVGEVLGDLLVVGHLRPQRLHGEFFIMRHLDGGDLRLPEQLLLLRQDLLEEVLVDGAGRRQIELD